jgi:hypothetical protein
MYLILISFYIKTNNHFNSNITLHDYQIKNDQVEDQLGKQGPFGI